MPGMLIVGPEGSYHDFRSFSRPRWPVWAATNR